MAIETVLSSAKSVSDLANAVQKRGDTLYRASNDLIAFKDNLKEFEEKQKSLQLGLNRYGLSEDETSTRALDNAKSLLEREQNRLRRFDNWWYFGCIFILCGISFPSELAQSLQKLNATITIRSEWDKEQLTSADLEARVKDLASQELGFRFKEDQRYVRLPVIENEIRDALENKGSDDDFSHEGCVHVVLLEGPSGTGKSSMARYLAMEYRAEIRNRKASRKASQHSVARSVDHETSKSHLKPERSSHDHGVQGTPHRSPCVFDEVIFLECGETIDPRAKQVELIKLLGWITDLEQKDNGTQARVKLVKDKEAQIWSEYLNNILSHLLQRPRVLLILDDVWDGDFVERIALCIGGKGSRLLVTAQRSRLCEDFSDPRLYLQSISMDRIDIEDARLILRVHAGLTFKDFLSKEILECMTKLIEDISTNPHALASVAAAIDKKHLCRLRTWKEAIEESHQQRKLDKDESDSSAGLTRPKLKAKFQGVPYTPSTGLKFKRLGLAEMDIMMLVAMFDGSSFPEEIIKICYTEICSQRDVESVSERTSSVAISSVRPHLEDLQCIQVREVGEQLYWSIHFLDREYLLSRKGATVQSIVEKFQKLPKKKQGLEEEPQEHLVKLLGSLFLSSEWADSIANALPLRVWLQRRQASNIRTRDAIQPIFDLMMEGDSKDWSLKERTAADQVFLSFMHQGILHEDAVRILLRCEVSKEALVDAVIQIAEFSDISLSEGILMDLLSVKGKEEYLEEDQNTLILNVEQCKLLWALAHRGGEVYGCRVRWSLCREEIVAGLLQAFRSTSNELDLRFLAIEIIGCLGRGEDNWWPSLSQPRSQHNRVAFLVNYPTLLHELSLVMEDRTWPSLQSSAAWALYQFARFADFGDDRVKGSITEGTGEKLVRSIAPSGNVDLQRWAVWALKDLASGSSERSAGIASFPDATDHLMALITSQSSQEGFDEVRKGAIYGLAAILYAIFPSKVMQFFINLSERAEMCIDELNELEKQGRIRIPFDTRSTARSAVLHSKNADAYMNWHDESDLPTPRSSHTEFLRSTSTSRRL